MVKRVIAAALIALTCTSVQARTLSAECSQKDEVGCLISMVLAYYANRTYGIDIGVEESQSTERSALYLAANKLSLAVLSPETYTMLETGEGAFRSNPEQAVAAASRLRALFGFADDRGRVTTIAVNDEMSYALAYNITAAFWNNFPSIRREVREIDDIGAPFAGVNMPLHPGALKYFDSKGYKRPEIVR